MALTRLHIFKNNINYKRAKWLYKFGMVDTLKAEGWSTEDMNWLKDNLVIQLLQTDYDPTFWYQISDTAKKIKDTMFVEAKYLNGK